MSQRPALAYSTADEAARDARSRKRCIVVAVPINGHVSTYWSVPDERSKQPGAWRRGHHVDPDPATAIARPARFYNWAHDPEMAA
jgi:hypothetical protein